MEFDAGKMHFPVYYPQPALLDAIRQSSNQVTPEKVRQVLGEFVFPSPPPERPYLYGCMVLSFDGKMGFSDNPEGHLVSKENHYDPVGAETDFWMMNVCRAYADAVILGTGTLKARLHRLWFAEVSDEDLVAARKGLDKKTPQPYNIIASVDGEDVPAESQILDIKPAPLIITSLAGAQRLQERLDRPTQIVTQPFDPAATSNGIKIVAAGEERPDTQKLFALLRASGLQHISVEAPGYIWHLIGQGLLDEYLLNYSGVMAGGVQAVGTQAPFTTENHPHAALLSIGFHKGFVFTRQKLV